VVKEGEGWQHPKGKDEVTGAFPLPSHSERTLKDLAAEDYLRRTH